MLTIIGRSGWGARPPTDRTTVAWADRTGFAVHYSAGPPTQTPGQIQDFHMDDRGWSDVGYNFLVNRDGTVFEGRGWLVVGAHAAPHNTSHIGVCFIGSEGDATDAAKESMRLLYHEANFRAGRSLAQTWHSGLPGQATECPGADLRSWVMAGMPSTIDNEDNDVALSTEDINRIAHAVHTRTVRSFVTDTDVQVQTEWRRGTRYAFENRSTLAELLEEVQQLRGEVAELADKS
ncbi:N-acetylmuramoyl-L-alanine amidase [Nocardiopsis exhalans]|uniref:N-acetylmuramoyl-L-alanine amidase n=1 Tax=Nocardiopsis exhalans TaxID=163604 RepID=A0ABY5DDH8_9ACTN|nr:N-acetylmuramoyl-L-alanine amidase [Nocardiopsis exhalans]USY21095.1 N-acetylmuramoyl-L-alanine amidase [Nocardiopsis exhalans]